MKRFLKNDRGISLVEVMVAAGISSVVALSTMQITTNSQKAMRKTAVSADLNSFFNIRLAGEFAKESSCSANLGPLLDGMAVGDERNNFASLIMPDAVNPTLTLTEGDELPGFEADFIIRDMLVSRVGDSACRFGLELERKNAADGKKLGAKNFTKYVDLSCGFNNASEFQFCSASGGNGPTWERMLDQSVNADHFARFADSNAPAAVIGDGRFNDPGTDADPIPPQSAFTIYSTGAQIAPWNTDFEDAIGLRDNHVLKWATDPYGPDSGVGLVGNETNNCISVYAGNESSVVPLRACANNTENIPALSSTKEDSNIPGNYIAMRANSTFPNIVAGTNTYGLLAEAGGANRNFGVAGYMSRDMSNNYRQGTAVYGCDEHSNSVNCSANFAGQRYAGFFDGEVSVGDTMTVNSTSELNGVVSINNGSAFSLYVSGNAVIDGNLSVNGSFSNPSDRRLKDDIQDSDLGLSFINSLRPVSYVYKKGVFKNSDVRPYRTGLIAQELEQSLKKHGVKLKDKKQSFVLTNKTKNGSYLSVAYTELIAPIINSVKELFREVLINREEIKRNHAEIKQLKEQNKVLTEALCLANDSKYEFCN